MQAEFIPCACGCGQPVSRGRRWVYAHHWRAYYAANPRPLTPVADRFWPKVATAAGDGCWLWTGKKHQHGYGLLRAGRQNDSYLRAHRVAWEIINGPIPPGLCVLHRCDVPACVRPDHLFLGTQTDNNRDKHAKGRTARGEQAGRAKLTILQVREIRARHTAGATQRALATEYGVTENAVWNLVNGRTWASTV